MEKTGDQAALALSKLSPSLVGPAVSSLGLDKEQRKVLKQQVKDIQSGNLLASKDVLSALKSAGVSKKDINKNDQLQALKKQLQGSTLIETSDFYKKIGKAADTKGITQEQAKLLTDMTNQTGKLGSGFSKLLGPIRTVGASLKTAFTSNPVGVILMALTLVLSILDKIIVSTEEQREKLGELKEGYTEIQDNIAELNEQMQTTNDRITELQNKGTLSLTEQEELDRLKEETAELQRQIDLEDLKAQNAQKNVNQQFLETMTSSENTGTGLFNIGSSEMEKAEANMEQYLQLKAQWETASGPEKEKIQEQMDEIDDLLLEQADKWASDMEGIDYIPNPTTEDDKKINDYLDYINNFQDQLAIAMGGNNAVQNAVNRIWNQEQFSAATQSLNELAKQGNLTQQSLSEALRAEGMEGLTQSLIESGVIADTSAESMDGLLEQILALNTEEPVAAIDELTNSLTRLQNVSNTLAPLQNALQSFQEDGMVSVDILIELTDAFRDVEGIENYIQALSEAETLEDATAVIQNLAAAYLDSTGILQQLEDGEIHLVVQQLKSIGVANAEALVLAKLYSQKLDLNTVTADTVAQLIDQQEVSEDTGKALANLALKTQLASLSAESFSELTVDQIGHLKSLAIQAGYTARAIELLEKMEELKQWRKEVAAGNIKIDDLDSYFKLASYQAYMDRYTDEFYQLVDQASDVQLDVGNSSAAAANDSEQSPAEQARNAWNELVAEKKHAMAMDELSEEAYYAWLQDNYQKYLSSEEDFLSDRRSIEEELYNWQKQQAEEQKQEQQELLQDQLNALKEFYDEQKQMLRDQYEEEDRIREQAEKRQTVTDLELQIEELSRDTSFKAQKRLQELREELAAAREELSDFEREQLLSETEQLYDDLYQQQETRVNSQIDALERAQTPEEIAAAIAAATATTASPPAVTALSAPVVATLQSSAAALPAADLSSLALAPALYGAAPVATAARTEIAPTITFGDNIVYANTDADFLRLLEAHRQQVAKTVVGVFKQM